MFSYMVELNDAESFLVAYSNCETVQILKNVERRLSQQMVMNDTLFFDHFLTISVYYSSCLLNRSGSKMK